MPAITTHITKCWLESGKVVEYDYCTQNRYQDENKWEYLGKGIMYSCGKVLHKSPQMVSHFFNIKK